MRRNNCGKPERAPHYRGLRPTDRPTVSVPSRDTDMLHMPMMPRGESLASSPGPAQNWITGDSYRTESENADDGKAKSRYTCATNCRAGTRDQQTSSSLSVSLCIFGFHVRQFVSPVTSHKPFFTFLYKYNSCMLHFWQDLHSYAHV